MENGKTYARRIRVGAKVYFVYASRGDGEELGSKVHEEDGYRFFLREETAKQDSESSFVNVATLPDEQSWSAFFPLDLVFLGRRRTIVHVMNRIAQRLRMGNTPVRCFQKGCRQQAIYYAEVTDSGGHWFACSEQHMSSVTTKGVPLAKEEFRRIKLI